MLPQQKGKFVHELTNANILKKRIKVKLHSSAQIIGTKMHQSVNPTILVGKKSERISGGFLASEVHVFKTSKKYNNPYKRRTVETSARWDVPSSVETHKQEPVTQLASIFKSI